MTYPHHPRFGSNYRGLTNRLDLLLECYSYLSFEQRVATAAAWQIETLDWVARHGDDVRQVIASSQRPPDRIAVRYTLEAFAEPITVLTRTPRTLDGKPTTLSLPHFARFVGTTIIDRPAAYLVPPRLASHLRRHGLAVDPAQGRVAGEIARVEAVESQNGRGILEAAHVGELRVSWRSDTLEVPSGWATVSTDQPLGAIAVYLCEPESDDGAVENGLLEVPALGADYPVVRLRG